MKNKNSIKKMTQSVVLVLSCVSIIWMVVTIVFAASYSVLVSDDFSNANAVGVFGVSFPVHIKAAFEFTKNHYLHSGGSYFSLFLQALLNPINRFWFRQLRCVMFLYALLFFVAYILFMCSLLKELSVEIKHLKAVIICISVFCLCAYTTYYDIWFWFTGATAYSLPFSLLLLGLCMFLRIGKKYSVIWIVGSVLCGIMAMGGVIAISGAGCYVALLISLHRYLDNNRIPAANLAVSGIWIVFAGINAFSPGNFARQGLIDPTGMHFFDGLIDAADMYSVRWNHLFAEKNTAFLMMIVLICGTIVTRSGAELNLKHIVIALLTLLTPYVTAFPLAFAHSSSGIPNRCAFLIDSAIILSSVYFSFICGRELIKLFDRAQGTLFKTMLVFLAIVFFTLDGYGLTDIAVRRVCEQLADGTYKEHHYACRDFLNSLNEYEEGTDVLILYTDFPPSIEHFQNFQLSDDASYYVNSSLAKYYGLNSIALY